MTLEICRLGSLFLFPARGLHNAKARRIPINRPPAPADRRAPTLPYELRSSLNLADVSTTRHP